MKVIFEELILNIGFLATSFFVIPMLLDRALYTFAKVTYELAHKK